jgi:dienelactone hydrolase
MTVRIDRREMVTSGSAWAIATGLAVHVSSASAAQAAAKKTRSDSFDNIVRASSGAVAALFSDFAVQSPEGRTCTARLAYPIVVRERLPVLVFCPDEGASANQYDQVTGALAASGFFVMAIDRRAADSRTSRTFQTPEQQGEEQLRRFAEARFLLDTIDAAAAALGGNADKLDSTRVGTIGHGQGVLIAVGLGGWDSRGAPTTRTRDGRVQAVVGLFPSLPVSPESVAAKRSPDGVSGMFIGDLAQMPPPSKGSGLLGLGMPAQSSTFGGLIGAPPSSRAARMAPEPLALAASVASMVLFFGWTLRGDNNQKRVLLALDGRRVEGLSAPLQLRKA